MSLYVDNFLTWIYLHGDDLCFIVFVHCYCFRSAVGIYRHHNLIWVFRELLHTKERQDETCERLHEVLGESCTSCELKLAGSQYDNLQGASSLSPLVAEELFRFTLSDKELHSQALSQDVSELKNASVKTDNSLSPVHTLLQINCVDHKGFLYDIMRTLKDYNIQVQVPICPSGQFIPFVDTLCQLNLLVYL